jgi:hypothetical protein
MFEVLAVVLVKTAAFGAVMCCKLSVNNCVVYVLVELV